MTFAVPADAYDRFMGRYSSQLSRQLTAMARVDPGHRVLDVGCGPGALTEHLVGLVGAEHVAAVDPSESFVEACRVRNPGVDVRLANAEELPFADDAFDAGLAQLVVHFMADPVRGLEELRRVTRAGGRVAATVWDQGENGMEMLTTFWRAARELDTGAPGESDRAGAREGHLVELFRQAGFADVVGDVHEATADYEDFDELWETFMHGVGPAGAYVAGLDADARAALRERFGSMLPDGPITLRGRAWAACATA